MTGRLHLDDLDFIASAPEGDARESDDRAAERYDHFRDLWLRSAGAGAERAMFEDVAGELRPGGDVPDADLARDVPGELATCTSRAGELATCTSRARRQSSSVHSPAAPCPGR